jgi:hypothetical protein
MNKQDALTKLAALEAETRALRAIIEAPDKPTVPTRWKPQDSGIAWFQVGRNGVVCGYKDIAPTSTSEYIYGNCYRTKAHAEIASEAVSITLKVCACAFEVDPHAGGAGQLDQDQRQWTVLKDGEKWEAVRSVLRYVGLIYVHTKEQADQLAAMLNAEGV